MVWRSVDDKICGLHNLSLCFVFVFVFVFVSVFVFGFVFGLGFFLRGSLFLVNDGLCTWTRTTTLGIGMLGLNGGCVGCGLAGRKGG